ncbi:ferredoxin reductase-like protein [Rhizopus microsporus var. microsporus]|uniref:NADH-cytochrome b5 reductase n=1 Tax=Rhizopus microsporus var. microsporus TaxID=86635 RepID=A0A1X0RGW4_RHIZD|nr:ferredoxin reductase-like protein [Rhizopus microsporus var. microsporus]
MRPLASAVSGAFRATNARPTFCFTSKSASFGNARHFSTRPEKKGGSKILLATLLGAGAVAGLTFNQSKTTVKPAVKEAVAEVKEKIHFTAPDFTPLKLVEVKHVSHNTKYYRFELPKDQTAGIPVASCVLARYQAEGEEPVVRPYTPISSADTVGFLEFVIKKYDTGKLTPILDSMKPGDTLEFKGPLPKYNWEKDQKTNVGLIAGGSGITPMVQIIRRVLDEKPTDKKTKITLIFANVNENDILLKDELDQIAKEHPDKVKIIYALDNPPEGWAGLKGYVTADAIKKYMPNPEDKDSIIMVCGPPPMVASLAGPKKGMKQGELGGILKELGYAQENVFKF